MIININIPFHTGQLTGTIECEMDTHITSSTEEIYGAYRRVEHAIDITNFEFVRLVELVWEMDDSTTHVIDYGDNINDDFDTELCRRWNRQLAQQDESFWLDTDMIINENPDLWIED